MDEEQREQYARQIYSAVKRLLEQYDFVFMNDRTYTNFFNDLAGILEI